MANMNPEMLTNAENISELLATIEATESTSERAELWANVRALALELDGMAKAEKSGLTEGIAAAIVESIDTFAGGSPMKSDTFDDEAADDLAERIVQKMNRAPRQTEAARDSLRSYTHRLFGS